MRLKPETWMHRQSLQEVNDIENRQAYHLAVKSKFSTMQFDLFGNKAFVELFIRFPICSVDQPGSLLKSFAKAWHSFRNSPEAKQIYVSQKTPGACSMGRGLGGR